MKIGYYAFDAGINYRDSQLGINELEDAKNVYWESGLKRRKGYDLRNAALSASSIYASSDVLSVLDYLYYEWGTASKTFVFAAIDSGGGSTADKMVVFQRNGLPASASASFSVLDSTAYAISYTDGDPFSAGQLKDKVYIANGEDDPYALYLDTVWKIAEVPVCTTQNDGSSSGAAIIANGSADDWAGAQFVAAFDHYLYLSDGKTLYFGLADKDVDPSKDIATGGSALIAGVQASWDITWYITLDSYANITKAVPYRDYLFLVGSKSFYQFYNKDFTNHNNSIQRVADKGIYGELLITPAYGFWVSDDGIWGYDGSYLVNLSKKIWPHIKTQNTIPTDLLDCTLAYYDGKVWISFPNGTNKEIFVFDPSLIYSDERGDTHAPFFRHLYYTGATPSAKGFTNLKTYDGRLFGISGKQLFELDVESFDNNSDATNKVPISWYAQSAYLDQDEPTSKKTYQRAVIETAANIDTTVALTATFYRDHGEASSETSTLDTTYTGNQRSYIELSIPYTIDGNTLSVKIAGDASGMSGTSSCVFYGFALQYLLKDIAKTEVG